jgi:two-component system response regulator LytT
MAKIKVGIVEDEMIIADRIAVALDQLGYEVTEPAISYTEALEMIERDKPDILLLDIVLSGHKDGIDLAWKIREDYNIPFIFLTANADPATVERAKKLNPPAYLVKPFSKDELYTSIEICLHNYSSARLNKAVTDRENYVINDCIFVKQGNNFIKVKLEDILYLKSDRIYITVYTAKNKMLVRSTIQNYVDIINLSSFVQVHRSYAVNLNHLESINTELLTIHGQEIPIGKTYRDDLLSNLRLG